MDFKRNWFDSRRACIKDFKEATRNGYDIVDSWGTEEYLLNVESCPSEHLIGERIAEINTQGLKRTVQFHNTVHTYNIKSVRR